MAAIVDSLLVGQDGRGNVDYSIRSPQAKDQGWEVFMAANQQVDLPVPEWARRVLFSMGGGLPVYVDIQKFDVPEVLGVPNLTAIVPSRREINPSVRSLDQRDKWVSLVCRFDVDVCVTFFSAAGETIRLQE